MAMQRFPKEIFLRWDGIGKYFIAETKVTSDEFSDGDHVAKYRIESQGHIRQSEQRYEPDFIHRACGHTVTVVDGKCPGPYCKKCAPKSAKARKPRKHRS